MRLLIYLLRLIHQANHQIVPDIDRALPPIVMLSLLDWDIDYLPAMRGVLGDANGTKRASGVLPSVKTISVPPRTIANNSCNLLYLYFTHVNFFRRHCQFSKLQLRITYSMGFAFQVTQKLENAIALRSARSGVRSLLL